MRVVEVTYGNEMFKPRVVWQDSGGRFRIVQRREDHGEKAEQSKTDFPLPVLFLLEETRRRDAMGCPVWTEVPVAPEGVALIYAFARDWRRVDKVLAQIADQAPRSGWEGAT